MEFKDCSLAEGVELRGPRLEHAAELFGVIERNRGRLRAWLPCLDSIGTVEDEANFLRMAEEQAAKDAALQLGIVCQGRIVGNVGEWKTDN